MQLIARDEMHVFTQAQLEELAKAWEASRPGLTISSISGCKVEERLLGTSDTNPTRG